MPSLCRWIWWCLMAFDWSCFGTQVSVVHLLMLCCHDCLPVALLYSKKFQFYHLHNFHFTHSDKTFFLIKKVSSIPVFVFNQQKKVFISRQYMPHVYSFIHLWEHTLKSTRESFRSIIFNGVDISTATNLSLICAIIDFHYRTRENCIDRRPYYTRHHHRDTCVAGSCLLLVATQAFTAGVCGAMRWSRNEQCELKVSTAAWEPTAGAVVGGAKKAATATAATSKRTSKQD